MMKSTDNTIPTVGRPRASGKETSGDSRRDILTAAGKLFLKKGFAGTSLREIGEEAGLRKASLYYYFKSKGHILAAMIDEVMAPPLVLIDRFKSVTAPPAAKLWAYLYVDTRQLCLAPYDYTWFLTVSETRTEEFDSFWTARAELLNWIEKTIQDGIEQGEFTEIDTNAAARAALSLDEFAVSWMAGGGKSPDFIATFVADFAVKALLRQPDDLAAIRDHGKRLAKTS